MRTRTMMMMALLSLSACDGKEKKEEAAKQEQAKVDAKAQELAKKLAADMEAKAAADAAAKKAEEQKAYRAELARSPKDFFDASGLKTLDNGPGKHTHAVTALTITNKSKYPALEVDVRVDFMQNGITSASIPLKLKGLLPAGGTRTFSVDDQTLESAAVKTPATETSIAIVSAAIDDSSPPGPNPMGPPKNKLDGATMKQADPTSASNVDSKTDAGAP